MIKIVENKQNYTPIIIGLGIAGVSGIALYKILKKKWDGTLQWYSDDEDQAGNIIKKKLNPKQSVKGWIDVRGLTKPLIVVGAQMANPVYGDLVTLGVMPDITVGDTNGYIYVKTYSGQTIYGVVGDLAQHTLAAANYIKENGLPTTDVTIPVV